ncbi:MAG: NUDIX domain-containing protein [Patescibacteria group bacterium]|nr:NUDIX domain-containing protein [Patescibacteria group bacterium]
MTTIKYDQIYRHHNVWGEKPNPLLQKILEKLEPGSEFLDLGCGQGRDALFMLQKGFKVTAIDNSEEGIKKMREAIAAKKLSLSRIRLFCQNIATFKIEPNKYSTINAYNSLHFLAKPDALRSLVQIKQAVKNGGYAIISCFFIKKPLAKKIDNKHCFIAAGELMKIFSDFEIILYEEKTTDNKGHAGCPEPHRHNVVKMIAQKVTQRARAIIIAKRKILLINRLKDHESYWVLPGGRVEANETIEKAIRRECLEELGIKVRVKDLFYEEKSAKSETAGQPEFFYLCEMTGGVIGTGQGPEFQSGSTIYQGEYDIKWVDLEKLPELNLKPEELKNKLIKSYASGN